jgi:hypothetical protein
MDAANRNASQRGWAMSVRERTRQLRDTRRWTPEVGVRVAANSTTSSSRRRASSSRRRLGSCELNVEFQNTPIEVCRLHLFASRRSRVLCADRCVPPPLQWNNHSSSSRLALGAAPFAIRHDLREKCGLERERLVSPLRYGADAEVIAPAELRAQMRAILAAALGRYAG